MRVASAVAIWIMLLSLLGLTPAAIALTIATVKSGLVFWRYMHLREVSALLRIAALGAAFWSIVCVRRCGLSQARAFLRRVQQPPSIIPFHVLEQLDIDRRALGVTSGKHQSASGIHLLAGKDRIVLALARSPANITFDHVA